MINFNDLTDKYLKKDFKPKIIGRYYPSEIGHCMRQSWYSYTSPKPTESSLLRVFEAGNRVHNFVVDVLKSEKTPEVELVESEMPLSIDLGDLIISGRIDNLVRLKMNQELVLVEVKSTSSTRMLTEPKIAHIMQLQLYLHAKELKKGMLLYLEKNTYQSKVFMVDYEKTLVDQIMDRFRALHKALITQTVPEPEGRLIKDWQWMCRSCPYRQECYEQTPDEVLAPKSESLSSLFSFSRQVP